VYFVYIMKIKNKLNSLKKFFIFMLILIWVFTGWPRIERINFPPKIEKVQAAAAATTVSDATTNNTATTIAPGGSATDAGRFKVIVSKNTTTITSATITFPASVVAGIASVQIWDSTETTGYLSASSPTGDTFVLTTGTAVPVDTTDTEFHILITPKSHANMPVPNGAEYAATAYVSAFVVSVGNADPSTDSADNAVTIDNLSPNDATSTSGSVTSDTSITIGWTTSNSADYAGSIVLRWQAATPGADVPVEGDTYSIDDPIGDATVACVENTGTASTAYEGVDGSGSDECSAVALSSGTQYSYKHFERDSRGNWNTGANNADSPLTTTGAAAEPTYTLSDYRWYVDNDLIDPTDPWGNPDIGEGTAINIVPYGNLAPTSTVELRLITKLTVNTENLAAGGIQFKLQFKEASDATCNTGSWTDVGAVASGITWRFANSTVEPSVLTDSNFTAASDVMGHYVSTSPSVVNTNTASATETIEYDFHIEHNGATSTSKYSFRVVESDNTVFDVYSECPTLMTGPETADLMRHGNTIGDYTGEQGFYWAN
jgi:hypothetical protein